MPDQTNEILAFAEAITGATAPQIEIEIDNEAEVEVDVEEPQRNAFTPLRNAIKKVFSPITFVDVSAVVFVYVIEIPLVVAPPFSMVLGAAARDAPLGMWVYSEDWITSAAIE
ncbi:hypothetical protein BJX64DRAFT_295116 [Aspergillus heterothallicus]